MRNLDFHEDDIGQIQILGAANRAHCERELEKIAAFSEQHADPDGAGWTKMYTRGEEPSAFRDLGLHRDRVADCLADIAEPFDSVSTGWSTHREPFPGVVAFGPSELAAVVAHHGDEGTIEMLWCILPAGNTPDCWTMAHMLSELGKIEPMILVDWTAGVVIDLSSPEQVASYVEHGEPPVRGHDGHQRVFAGRISRWLPLIGLGGGLTLLSWLILDPGVKFWVATGFGLIVTMAGVVPALPGAFRLRLMRDGFEVTAFWKRKFRFWREVEHFRVIRPHREGLVGWNIRQDDEDDIGLFAGLPAVDDHLPDTFGMDAQALADLMEQWRSWACGNA